MYVRNLLKPGDFIAPIPVGLSLTLQYNDKGVLQKVYKGHQESDRENISDKLLSKLFDAGVVPTKIPITGGTTWVLGTLYTRDKSFAVGSLPDCISSDLIQMFNTSPGRFTFYAGHVSSLAASFQGRTAVMNWLNIAKFKTMFGAIVPYNLSKESFDRVFKISNFPYELPLIAGYIVYRDSEVLFESTQLSQVIVKEVNQHLDRSGYVKAKLYTYSSSEPIVVNYTDAVRFNIHKNSLIVLDKYNNIIYSCPSDNYKRGKRSGSITCSVCGKPIECKGSGPVACDDPHCLSKMYPEIEHLANGLNLPVISYTKYMEYVKQKKLTCLSDMILLEEYADADIQTSISQFLAAVVPATDVSDASIFDKLTNRCKNNVQTVMYYIQHPDRIIDELNLSGVGANQLVRWLSDNYNSATLDALFDAPNIHFKELNKSFDGAPMFRNRTIMITGQFIHGSDSDIAAILQSYAATVVDTFSDAVNCVVVGDIPEGVNTVALRKAQNAGVPIFSESLFFHQYNIDDDLVENL